jgi:hypothetical protein
MIDDILRYISLITVAGAGISFVVGLVKYLDQRNREERTKRFELYHDLMRRISAQGDRPNEGLPLTQQVAAVYELQHFKDYTYASLPILKHLREIFEEKKVPPVLMNAIDETITALSR